MEEVTVTCNYARTSKDGILVWECDSCGHIEYVPFKIKDWIYCPFCGKAIKSKDGINPPMDD